jgi:hypothetical protein
MQSPARHPAKKQDNLHVRRGNTLEPNTISITVGIQQEEVTRVVLTLVACASEDVYITLHARPPEMFANPVVRDNGATVSGWTLVRNNADAKAKMIKIRNIHGIIRVEPVAISVLTELVFGEEGLVLKVGVAQLSIEQRCLRGSILDVELNGDVWRL